MNNQNQEQNPQGEAPKPPLPRNYNPFLDSVIEKPYSQISVGVTQEQLNNPISEPSYSANPINTNKDIYGTFGGSMGGSMGGGSSSQSSSAINPSLNDVPNAEKKEAATHMAKLVMDAYEGLNKFANKAVQISPTKVRKLVAEGELDLSVEIPYEADKTISMGEFIEEFNEQNKETFVVTKEFKKEVMPVLIRVLEKKGAGLNDEQFLGFMVLKDIGVKAFLGFQIRSSLNDVINLGKEFTQQKKDSGIVDSPKPKASASKPKAQPQPEPTRYYEDEVPKDSKDFNFMTNEANLNSIVQPMDVPKTGKSRLMAQKAKEKVWQENSNKAVLTSSSYDEMMKNRSNNGKRGRKPKTANLSEEDIVDAIILQETKETKDKIEGID
jgi:hypothetical protein